MSALRIRMQPWEGRPGISSGSFVPWMPDHAAGWPFGEHRVVAGAERVGPIHRFPPARSAARAPRNARSVSASSGLPTPTGALQIEPPVPEEGRAQQADVHPQRHVVPCIAPRSERGTQPVLPLGLPGMRSRTHSCPGRPRGLVEQQVDLRQPFLGEHVQGSDEPARADGADRMLARSRGCAQCVKVLSFDSTDLRAGVRQRRVGHRRSQCRRPSGRPRRAPRGERGGQDARAEARAEQPQHDSPTRVRSR